MLRRVTYVYEVDMDNYMVHCVRDNDGTLHVDGTLDKFVKGYTREIIKLTRMQDIPDELMNEIVRTFPELMAWSGK